MRLGVGVASCLLVACAGSAPLEPLPRFPAHAPAAPPPAVKARASEAPLVTPRATSEPTLSTLSLPSVSQGDIGSAGPVRLLGASASGAWVALCEGQPKTARLVLGSGTGEEIDDVLARDASGRYVVVLAAGKALLVDALSGTRVDLSELGADTRRLRADYAEHRSLSFDQGSEHLAYLKKDGGQPTIVVRELASGRERAFAAGVGEILSLRLSADARYVGFEALRDDSNHNGKLDWPAPEDVTRGSVCDKPALPRLRSYAYQGRGDAIVRGVVALDSGSVRDVPELVTPLGASLLLRAADGSLLLERAGKRTPLAPAACAGRVLFADAERELVLATCAPPPPKKLRGAPTPPPTGKREVWLFGGGSAKSLKSELYETSTDRDAVIGARLVPIYPGSEAALLDLERRELVPLPTGSRVLTTAGPVAVVWQGSDLFRYDAVAKRQERLARGVLKNPDFLQAGRSILLSPFLVVDGAAPALVSPGPALAITSGGMVLVPTSKRAGAGQVVIEGPLHWLEARAASTTIVTSTTGH